MSKVLTKWEPLQTFGHMQQTQRKEKNNLQTQHHLLRNMHFFS